MKGKGRMPGSKPYVWLEWCPYCHRKHRVTMQTCPECGIYPVPQPISDNVANDCCAPCRCDGCDAYQDHLR